MLQIRIGARSPTVMADPIRIAFPAIAMNVLPLLSLLAVAGFTLSANAAESTPAAGACITLNADQQIVRANADRDVLLRNGDQHYIVRFESSCNSAARSRSLAFATPGQNGQVCGGGISALDTQTQKCSISELVSITPKEFATRAKARR